jgi:alpha-galactosidase
MSVFFLGIAGYMGTILYERASAESRGGSKPAAVVEMYNYPARVELESAEGRILAVTLQGRSEEHVQFTREDGEEFVYPIASLALEAQTLVRRYPNVRIKNAGIHLNHGSLELGGLYVQQLQEAIQEIDQKVNDLSREYASSVGQTAKRTIRRKVEGLQAEKIELNRKITERQ